MHKFKNISPETTFLIIGLIYGIGFLFATPAFQVPDEYEHFYRAVYVSEGHIVPEKLGDKSGVYVPESIGKTSLIIHEEWSSFIKDRENKLNLTPPLYIPLKSKYMVFDDISRIAVVTYSPVPYIVSGFAISLGKFFNLSPIILMYLGRLANLLMWLILTYSAIKIIPVHKWVLFMLSFIPLTLFEAASISADSFMLGLSFLIIAIFLKYAFSSKKRLIVKDIYIIFVVLLLIALSKQVYFVLLFLVLLIPPLKFGNMKKMMITTALLFISISLIIGSWSLFVKDLYVPIVPQISIQGQIFYILGDPLRFPYVILNTFLQFGLSYQLLFVGNFILDIPLPVWWIGIYILSIFPVALLDTCEIEISLRQKLISTIVFLLVFLLLCAFVYVSWTPVGQNTIDGIQGRYFIPIMPLLFILFYKWSYIRDLDQKTPLILKNNLNLIITCCTAVYLTITLLIFIVRYYI